jgi:hypothetical protein
LGFGTLAAALPTGGVATGAVEMVSENGAVYHKDDHFDRKLTFFNHEFVDSHSMS